MSITFQPGQQVEVYSGDNVLHPETLQPFWYRMVVTAGPFVTNNSHTGYYVLGPGSPEPTFNQYCKLAMQMRPAEGVDEALAARYEAFRKWAGQ
ncbi:hypothetical protein SEA_CHILL_46 [Mycobacterium phage Chill]|uniref:Uncharacterized protein n=3 Tax=Plotvirus plot TaxID=2170099 RepID=A0A2Z4Q043_9CAUD|nr:hypothetical protein ERK16_44 [Mycobacterium phage Erk16]QBI97110.1 hypothetical protein SEA_CHILL_46 [Mycobacterium phage Chill]QBP30043.1 hypothetical protein SEA_WALDOWHY_46 [Mycobacterium phage WaldoWhy]